MFTKNKTAETVHAVTVVTTCRNAAGASDFALTCVLATRAERDLGLHLEEVEGRLRDDDYESPFLHFEEGDAPPFLFPGVRKYLGIPKEN